MSEITEAWDELYAAQTSAIGTAQKVVIGAVTADAISQDVPLDVGFAEGSLAYGQPFDVQVKASALSNTEPPRNTAISFTPVGSARAVVLSIISCRSNNGIFYLTIGDPNAGD